MLLHEGQSDDTLHLLISGRMAVSKRTSGEALTLHIMEPGALAGEMGFVDRTRHTVSLVAMEPATVLCLRREAFEALVPQYPELIYHVMRAIVRLEHRTLGRMNLQFVEMHNYITKSNGRY
jgi:CRP-like cAMP-binding protein